MRDPRAVVAASRIDLVLARHAPVRARGVCYGHSAVPLEVGADAAAEKLLSDARAPRARVVHASPLARCREPAELVAAQTGAELRIDARLCELSMGAWDGRMWDDIERADVAAYAAWMARWQELAPPGGETVSELELRVAAWLASLQPDVPHLLVAHAGVARALLVLTRDLTWDAAMAIAVPHLEVTTLDALAERRPRTSSLV
jgi:alpha-ribazole phosphatase